MQSARTRFAAVATLALVTGLVWVPPVSQVRAATTIQVPGDYTTIQAAINAAAAGDTIEVSAGTYPERLTIDKSLTLVAVDGPDATTIDGELAGQPIITATMPASSSLTVQGFRFWRGHAWSNDYGGAILLSGAADATITGNVFESNHADLAGGAIFTTATGSVTIEANRFISNGAQSGGAVQVTDADATTIASNVFAYNSANIEGGAITWQAKVAKPASIRSNTFAWNGGQEGTAVHLYGELSTSIVRNNAIVANTTQSLVSCSLLAVGQPAFTSNDFWNHGSGAAVIGCDDPLGGGGNLSVDPVLRNPDWDDFHLRPDSPLIDAGAADAGVTTDIDGDARPFDGDESGGAQIDIGADESTDPLLIDPDYFSFGSTYLGFPVDRTVTLSNLGASTLSITSASITGGAASQFSEQSDTCTGASLAVGESCSVEARYAPTQVGISDAFLAVTGPGAVGTRSIQLNGSAFDAVSVGPSGWGEVPVGSTAAGTLTIINQHPSESFTVTSVALSGAQAGDFTIVDNPCQGATLDHGDQCVVTINFKPTALGIRTVTITVTGPSPVGTRSTDVTGEGIWPATPVTLGSTYSAGPAYTWNSGNALARTLKSTTQYLHQGYATDRISGSWAKDTGGPYAGIYYTRSGSGSSWGTPRRISPTSIHAIRFGLAASGSRVYVAYATQTRIYNFSNTAPRVLYLRTNTNHGSSSYWKTPVKLTSSTGRVDYPTVAASGYDVHVAWTDSVTGYVYVATSKDRGATWTKRKVGTTTNASSEGKIGYPSVAVSGSTVAVTWVADANGALRSRVSTDRGSTWRTSEQVTALSSGQFQTAVRSGRVAVVFTDGFGVHVRTWTSGGGWGDDYLAVDQGSFFTYSPSISLQGSARIAISWAEETSTPNYVRLRYAESTSNGATWYQPITLASTSSSTRRVNDWPSMVWPAAGTRYISWNGWTNGTNSYRLYLRKGTGTPVGLASVARVMTPDAGIAPAAATPRTGATVGWLPQR